MFGETPESDRVLKDIAIKYAGNNHAEILELSEFPSICKGKGEIALQILRLVPVASKPCMGNKAHVCYQTQKYVRMRKFHEREVSKKLYICNYYSRKFNRRCLGLLVHRESHPYVTQYVLSLQLIFISQG
jgi:hypothetical protein